MAKSAKAAPTDAEAPAKPKNKKMLLAIIGVLVLGAAGGAGWYFMKGSQHNTEEAPKAAAEEAPTFVVLEPYTVNLQREESDLFLQIAITLKVSSAGNADKIREHMPEIRSRLLFMLSSKRPSELIPIEGKRKLAREIIAEINTIIGLRSAAPKAAAHENNATSSSAVASGETTPSEAASAPVEAAPSVPAPGENTAVAHGGEGNTGVQDVLFTAFIIQ